MSLINQVLNDLEKRGANGPLVDMPIRAVHAENKLKAWMYVSAGAVLLCIVAVVWWLWSKPVAVQPIAVVAPIIAGNTPAISPVVVVSQSQAESQVVSAEQADEQERAVASRLSFELTSIPLPNSLRGKPLVELAAPLAVVAPPAEVASKTGTNKHVEPIASISKQLKKVSPQQQAENEFRKANLLAQQGHLKEAAAGYEAALYLDPVHVLARESLVAVLLESKRNAEAEKVLQDGLNLMPKQTHFAMLLARLQVERNALILALDTLDKTAPYADQLGDYQAFMAALLQRQNRHKEAITHYQIALQLSPNSGLWLMGLGISLQAVQRQEDARDVYKRALEAHSLSPELQAFVAQRLKEIKL